MYLPGYHQNDVMTTRDARSNSVDWFLYEGNTGS